MDAAHGKRIIVLAGSREDAGPVVADLRACGYEVRVAGDSQVASRLWAGGKADLILGDRDSISGGAVTRKGEGVHLGAAVGGAFDDLRSLLNAVSESLGELRELTSVAPFAGRAEALTRARQRILRAQELLSDLPADIWNGEDQEPRVVDANLQDLVEAAAITVYGEASRKDQRLVIDIDEEATRVRADRAKLKRVLAGLLAKAVRHTPVGGTVTIRASRDGADCLISVSDSGESISADEIPGPFRQPGTVDGTQPARKALGLRVVQTLVEQHGGRVWVESRPGQGTTVFVSLPQPARPAETETREVDLPRDGQEASG